jgi:type IV secretion system protein VirD4
MSSARSSLSFYLPSYSGITYGEQHTGRPQLTPDEVRRLPPESELLFLAGQAPHIAHKLKYYADPEFAGQFDEA